MNKADAGEMVDTDQKTELKQTIWPIILPAIIWFTTFSGVNLAFYLNQTETEFTTFNVKEKTLHLKYPKHYSLDQVNIITQQVASNYSVLRHADTVTWPYEEAKKLAVSELLSNSLYLAVTPAIAWILLCFFIRHRKNKTISNISGFFLGS